MMMLTKGFLKNIIIAFLLLMFGQKPASFSNTDKPLVLNGVSTKEATFLDVKVFKAKFYVEEKTSEVAALVKQRRKKFVLEFLRDVSAKKLRDSWMLDLRSACASNCKEQLMEAKEFLPKLPDVQADDRIVYDIDGEVITVQVNNSVLGKLSPKGLAETLTLAFIGHHVSTQFKNPLLGKTR